MKKTLAKRALKWVKKWPRRHVLFWERRESQHAYLVDAWLAGYQAARRDVKKETKRG